MKNSIVLGFAFGDEGKGAVVQALCRTAIREGRKPLVIRFNGGPQAGHTVCHDSITHICSSYGSGTLLGVDTFITYTAMFDPICMHNEYLALVKEYESVGKDIKRLPKVFIHEDAHVITPYDTLLGRANEKIKSDGTCGKGIYMCYRRDEVHEDIYGDLRYPTSGELSEGEQASKELLDDVEKFYRDYLKNETMDEFFKEYDRDALRSEFIYAMNELLRLGLVVFVSGMRDIQEYTKKFSEDHQEITECIYEGAQGLLLDMDFGYFPNVTPSHTGLLNLMPKGLRQENIMKQEDTMVYLVTRTYLTRHGNGYIPMFPLNPSNGICKGYGFLFDPDYPETNSNNEWQGEFKIGALELSLLNDAVSRHHLDNYPKRYGTKFALVVTHMDTVQRAGTFYYELNGRLTQTSLIDKPSRVVKRITDNLRMEFCEVYMTDHPSADELKPLKLYGKK